MQRRSSVVWVLGIVAGCLLLGFQAGANPGIVSNLAQWDVASYKVNLLEHRGVSGDVQIDQNGWIHIGANHLDGGDVKYAIPVGRLNQDDILEVWVDGFSSSNDLDLGPTVFIGAGKNRFEQITRISGDAWRPFVFRFADEGLYGDVTDPSNRNENWRIRYPSSKYELRRVDKAPDAMLDRDGLPVRISITGPEDYVLKRMEVVVYRTGGGGRGRGGMSIVRLEPYRVSAGQMVTAYLNQPLPEKDVNFYLVNPTGSSQKVTPRILNTDGDKVGFYTGDAIFARSGTYQVKVVDRAEDGDFTDTEHFEYVAPQTRVIQKPKQPKPKPVVCVPPCQPVVMPPVVIQPMPMAQVRPPMLVVPVRPPVMVAPQYIQQVQPVGYYNAYTIQIGAFSTQGSAVNIMNTLRQYGFDAYISESVSGRARVFRVRVGRYPNKDLALRDASRLRQSGFETWVTPLS